MFEVLTDEEFKELFTKMQDAENAIYGQDWKGNKPSWMVLSQDMCRLNAELKGELARREWR